MRARRCSASASSASVQEPEASMTSSTTCPSPSSAIRRVPALPQEYDEDEEMEREEAERSERSSAHRTSSPSPATSFPSSTRSSRYRTPSSSFWWLLPLLLLLLLLQPASACLDGCVCSEDGQKARCAPGTFTRDFPYLLPSGITHLDLSGNELKLPEGSINDFGTLSSLHTLIMRNCSLTALPAGFVDGMASLRRLDLAANDIREVNAEAFSGVQGLEHLDLSSNRRISLPLRAFDRLETLRSLDLSGCGLRELEQGIFHGLEQLEELRLQKNSLSMLPRGLFSQQRVLRELDLAENKLDTTSSLSSLPLLHSLNLAGNSIKYMDRLDHLVGLERLDASHNHVLSLPSPPSFPSSLRFLDLSHNALRHLQTAAFDTLTELRHLNLSHNKHLEDVQINVFVSLNSLEHLSLAHCSALATISPSAFQPLPSSLRTLHLGGIGRLKCSDCKLRSFPDTVELRGRCVDETNQHVQLADLGSCDAVNVVAILILAGVVAGLLLILVLLMVCCKSGNRDSRPVTPATAKHANYGYGGGGGQRKSKKHSSLSPPLLASSSSSSTSPSGGCCVYEARLGAGPIGGGIIYAAPGYLEWDPVTMLHYGREGTEGDAEGSSSGNSSGRSEYSEIPAYAHQNRYCVPRSTVARAFSAASASAPGAPRLPQTPPPSGYPQGVLFPPSGTLYPPPKYSPPPPPPPTSYYAQQQQEGQPQLLLQTPLALQQQLHHQQQHQQYSPLTRL